MKYLLLLFLFIPGCSIRVIDPNQNLIERAKWKAEQAKYDFQQEQLKAKNDAEYLEFMKQRDQQYIELKKKQLEYYKSYCRKN